MPNLEPYIEKDADQPDYLDWKMTASGDREMTDEVVLQNAFKAIVMVRGNFVLDTSLGSLLYRLPPFGARKATYELGKSYIRQALLTNVGAEKIQIEQIDVTGLRDYGCDYKILFVDLTTNRNFNLESPQNI